MPSPRRAAKSTTGSEANEANEASTTGSNGPRVLKKYPNRRLYDTHTSSYITLADVKQMVLAGQAFVVRDAKTGDELTRSILLQIILEEETGGVPIFSAQALSQIIRFYGHATQGAMGNWLEQNLQAMTDMQAQFLKGQAPVLPGLMGNYLEQSKAMVEQMQEQFARQAESLFPFNKK